MMKQRWGLDRNVLRLTPGDPWDVEQHHWNTGAEENQQLNPGGPSNRQKSLSEAKLTVNLAKSEFCHANLTFLGHIVGQGRVKPVEAKVEAISDFPVPTGKRQLKRFLGMVGYYRKFCNNFSVIAEPLTNLLGKRVKYVWTEDCQKSFDKLKAIFRSAPVLLAPSFDKEFKVAGDASDVGAGSVLLQEDDNGVDHPVCYFSKKFNKHQRHYSTIEKECLSLILSLQHFEVYLASSITPVIIFSDQNPLTFIHKMKNKNQRFLRWSLMLQKHNLDIRHIKGKDNLIPDALSRAYIGIEAEGEVGRP